MAGYSTQIYYDGIPVGEPSEKIVYRSNKVDRDAIEKAIKDAVPILTKSVMAALSVFSYRPQEVYKKQLKKPLIRNTTDCAIFTRLHRRNCL